MADNPGDATKKPTGTDAPATSATPKRPFATIDLKATEIRVTPVSASSVTSTSAASSSASSMSAGAPAARPVSSASAAAAGQSPRATPGPAPAATFAAKPGDEMASNKPTASTASAEAISARPKSSPTTSSAATSSPQAAEPIVIKKRGGFFSHFAASVIGGLLALAGAEWALPQLGITGTTSRLADNTAALSARVSLLEQRDTSATTPIEGDLAARVEKIEKSTAQIADQSSAVTESQARLVADTKAALASAANETGATDQLTRIAALEDKLKALADAGANDPNANRLAQLAALTGKVADLETSLSTQLTALRKSVADDVDGRIMAATEASEAAKSGTQRIDRDVATVKGDAVRLEERLLSLKADIDRLTATATLAQENATKLTSELNAAKAEFTRPADIAAAIDPVASKLAGIDERLQTVLAAEDERRASSGRIVLALELQNLKRSLNSGTAFASELIEVEKAAGPGVDLTPLATFKDTGIAPVAALVGEFRTLAYSVIEAETEPAEGGVVDRLLAGAKSVVRVRKVNHTPDDKTAEAVVGRMELALKDGKLGDVLEQSRDLGPKAQVAVKPFLDKVAARVSVDQAVAALEVQLKSSLKATEPAAPAP